MTTQTSAPIGSTGQNLEGVSVDTAAGLGLFRESVVQADPADPNAYSGVISTSPSSDAYGSVVRIAGAFPVNVTVTANEITSSIPFYVAQSSAPWTVNGGIAVTNVPTVNVTNVPLVTVQGTSSVNVLSSVPHAISGTVSTQVISSIPFFVAQSSSPWTVNGGMTISSVPTVSTQIISSIPFFVAQSSAPWDMRGGVAVTNSPNVNVTNVPAVNITTSIPFFVAQSSAPWTVIGSVGVSSQTAVSSTWPLNTTMVNVVSSLPLFVSQSSAPWSVTGTTSPNVVSSIPYWVAQSSSPWSFVETVSTAGGMSATTIPLMAHLNTTVVKGTAGQLYGILGANVGSSQVFVRLYNVSTAATLIASTGVPLVVWGLPVSTSPYNNYDAGIPFSAGIGLITQQQPYTASSSVAPTASTASITILFK